MRILMLIAYPTFRTLFSSIVHRIRGSYETAQTILEDCFRQPHSEAIQKMLSSGLQNGTRHPQIDRIR